MDGLREEALLPFRVAIAAGVQAIMTAHVVVRSVDKAAATLNRALLHDLLRVELGFRGLVVTDALEMRAISGQVGPGEAAARAVLAGADAVCLGHDLGDETVKLAAAAERLLGAASPKRRRDSSD